MELVLCQSPKVLLPLLVLLSPQGLSPKQSTNEETSSASYVTAMGDGPKTLQHPLSWVNNRKLYKTTNDYKQQEEFPSSLKLSHKLNIGKSELVVLDDVLDKIVEVSSQKHDLMVDKKSCIRHSVDVAENGNLAGFLEYENIIPGSCKGGVGKLHGQLTSQSGISFCQSPQNSLYSATLYAEAKQSFTNTELSECSSHIDQSGESAEVSNSCDLVESRKTSIYRGSTGSDVSDESSSSSFSSAMYKPHKGNDSRCEVIRVVRSRDGALGLNHFRLLSKLGCGDIGSVYLSELSGTKSYFAMKVMDKAALASRKKLLRAQTEREILQSLDHPFLPTL